MVMSGLTAKSVPRQKHRTRGQCMTRQKAVVLEVIRSDMCHHTAEEIYLLARERLPSISRATVYNNLRALEKEQIIRRITGDGLADRYDNSFIPHGHALCKVCGRVWDFQIEGFEQTVAAAVGSDFDSYELKVRTLCEQCRGRCAPERD